MTEAMTADAVARVRAALEVIDAKLDYPEVGVGQPRISLASDVAAGLATDLRTLLARLDDAERDAKRLASAVRWALGEEGDFTARAPGQGRYWWRQMLRHKAGMFERAASSPGAPTP